MKFGPRWGQGEQLQDTATAVVFHEDISFIFHSGPYGTSLLSEYFQLGILLIKHIFSNGIIGGNPISPHKV